MERKRFREMRSYYGLHRPLTFDGSAIIFSRMSWRFIKSSSARFTRCPYDEATHPAGTRGGERAGTAIPLVKFVFLSLPRQCRRIDLACLRSVRDHAIVAAVWWGIFWDQKEKKVEVRKREGE